METAELQLTGHLVRENLGHDGPDKIDPGGAFFRNAREEKVLGSNRRLGVRGIGIALVLFPPVDRGRDINVDPRAVLLAAGGHGGQDEDRESETI